MLVPISTLKISLVKWYDVLAWTNPPPRDAHFFLPLRDHHLTEYWTLEPFSSIVHYSRSILTVVVRVIVRETRKSNWHWIHWAVRKNVAATKEMLASDRSVETTFNTSRHVLKCRVSCAVHIYKLSFWWLPELSRMIWRQFRSAYLMTSVTPLLQRSKTWIVTKRGLYESL